jgi:outer membrane protein TolC
MAIVGRRVWLVAGLALGLSRAGAAQTPLSLTLGEAIERGVREAPRLAGARAHEAAATATVDSRAAQGAPTITARTSYLRTNHVDQFGVPQANGSVRVIFPDIPDNFDVRTELAVPLITSGRTAASVGSARAELAASQADHRSEEEDVRLDVSRAYWTLVTAREATKVLEQELQRMDAYVGDVQARVNAGVLPPNDLLSAQAERASQQVQLIQARNAAALAEIDLARLVGADLGQPLVTVTPVDAPLPDAVNAAGQPIDALVARARAGRSERLALQDRQTGLREGAEAARASTRPLVSGLAAVEPGRPNQRFVPRVDQWKTSWDLSVTLYWPLWDGGRARADRASALAQADELGHRLDDFDQQMAVEIRQRLLDLDANQAALTAADVAVAAATEARRVLGERFTAGVATGTDVIDAQIALLQAELERTQIAAALRVGEARLLRAVGGL